LADKLYSNELRAVLWAPAWQKCVCIFIRNL
jgi:hypothetical protein